MAIEKPTNWHQMPDQRGHFGPYGGIFVSETLMGALSELNVAYERYMQDETFLAELDADLANYVGRPSPLYHAERWSGELGGCTDLSEARGSQSHRRSQGE